MKRLLVVVGSLLLSGCAPSRQSLSAGHVGCRPSEITITDETVGTDGFRMSSENWVAECAGKRFICTQISSSSPVWTRSGQTGLAHDTDVSCKEELSSSGSSSYSAPAPSTPPPPTTAPPKGGASFELGSKTEAAQAACESAGHTWQPGDEKAASCSGMAATVGFAAPVTFKLCSGLVCGISFSHKPETDWLGTIAEPRNGLEVKYGPARERDGELPEDCRTKSAFINCRETDAYACATCGAGPAASASRSWSTFRNKAATPPSISFTTNRREPSRSTNQRCSRSARHEAPDCTGGPLAPCA